MTATSNFSETKKDMPWTTAISEGSPSVKSLVSDNFTEMLEYAGEAWDTANQLILDLTSLDTITSIDIGNLEQLDLTDLSGIEVTKYTAPTAPDTTVTLPDEPADQIAPDFYEEEIALNPVLAAKLLEDLNSGGTGLGAEVEEAMWARAKTRLEEDRVVKIQEITEDYASRGWDNIGGALDAATAQVTRDYNKRIEEVTEQIAVEQARLALNNAQFTVQQSMSYITASRTWFVQHSEFLLKKFEAQVSTWKTIVDTMLRELESKVSVYKTETDAFSAQVEAEKNFIASKIAVQMASIDEFKANVQFVIERETLKLDREKQISNVTLQGAQQGAGFTSQLAASALGALHTTAQISSSAGISQSVGWDYRYGQSISESVSNSEDYNTNVSVNTD